MVLFLFYRERSAGTAKAVPGAAGAAARSGCGGTGHAAGGNAAGNISGSVPRSRDVFDTT